MRIGIAGSGGVGGMLGAFLVKAGAEVAFLARGAHGAAMRERGLRFQGTLGDFTVTGLTVRERGEELGVCDVVFVATKTWQLASVMPHVKAMVGPGTVVVPLLNGIVAWDIVADALGEAPVVGGIIFVNSQVESPGVLKQVGNLARIVMGERRGGTSARLEAIRAVVADAGFTCDLDADVLRTNWEKFLGFEPMALVGALSRSTIGTFRADAAARAVLVTLMNEVTTVGRRKGVALSDDVIERRLGIIDGLAIDATISMQRDLMAGRPSEFDEQSLGFVALARSLGVPTPAHDVCVPLLALQERAARAKREA